MKINIRKHARTGSGMQLVDRLEKTDLLSEGFTADELEAMQCEITRRIAKIYSICQHSDLMLATRYDSSGRPEWNGAVYHREDRSFHAPILFLTFEIGGL